MSLLSHRVKKAKQLRITKTGRCYNTWGSGGDTYKVYLTSSDKEIVTPDGFLTIKVFMTKCEKCILHYNSLDCDWTNCKGNTGHTVCYHCIGAIYKSFQDAKISHQVSFYKTYRDADRALTFGGFLAKIENNNGKGCIWCVVRTKPGTPETKKINLLPREQNLSLMRGEEEGIE